jgi:hypothetical protein
VDDVSIARHKAHATASDSRDNRLSLRDNDVKISIHVGAINRGAVTRPMSLDRGSSRALYIPERLPTVGEPDRVPNAGVREANDVQLLANCGTRDTTEPTGMAGIGPANVGERVPAVFRGMPDRVVELPANCRDDHMQVIPDPGTSDVGQLARVVASRALYVPERLPAVGEPDRMPRVTLVSEGDHMDLPRASDRGSRNWRVLSGWVPGVGLRHVRELVPSILT